MRALCQPIPLLSLAKSLWLLPNKLGNINVWLLRSLLRKYPNFPDMRAALAAALWGVGEEAKAESEWQRVDDPRYR